MNNSLISKISSMILIVSQTAFADHFCQCVADSLIGTAHTLQYCQTNKKGKLLKCHDLEKSIALSRQASFEGCKEAMKEHPSCRNYISTSEKAF